MPTQALPCELGATATDPTLGDIASQILLCPPLNCNISLSGCVGHRWLDKSLLNCGIDTTVANIGTNFQVRWFSSVFSWGHWCLTVVVVFWGVADLRVTGDHVTAALALGWAFLLGEMDIWLNRHALAGCVGAVCYLRQPRGAAACATNHCSSGPMPHWPTLLWGGRLRAHLGLMRNQCSPTICGYKGGEQCDSRTSALTASAPPGKRGGLLLVDFDMRAVTQVFNIE